MSAPTCTQINRISLDPVSFMNIRDILSSQVEKIVIVYHTRDMS